MTDWLIEFRGERIAQLGDGFVPDQFWVHFRLEVMGNSLGIHAQTLASHDWWNVNFEDVRYCSSDGSIIVLGENVIPSPQSASVLALRSIGFTFNQRSDRSKLETARREKR